MLSCVFLVWALSSNVDDPYWAYGAGMSKNSHPYFKRLPRALALALALLPGLLPGLLAALAALAALGTLALAGRATEFTAPEGGILIHLRNDRSKERKL